MSAELKPPSKFDLFREMFAAVDMVGMPFALLKASQNGPQPAAENPVIVLPGLGANDFSTAPLRYFLNKNGFKTEGWGLGLNTGGRGLISDLDQLSDRWDIDPDRSNAGEGEVPALCDKMVERVKARAEAEDTAIALVGWSLGGYVAREVARELPDHVSCVVTMGSPVVGGPKYTSAAPIYSARNFDLDWIAEETKKRHNVPIHQPITAIYSKRDGVVGWQASIDKYSPNVTHMEVNVSHIGLGMNAGVWGLVLDALRSSG